MIFNRFQIHQLTLSMKPLITMEVPRQSLGYLIFVKNDIIEITINPSNARRAH